MIIIATPKLPPGIIGDLRNLTQEFLSAHDAGGYAEDSKRIREGNLNAFLMFLEGNFDPATEKYKKKA